MNSVAPPPSHQDRAQILTKKFHFQLKKRDFWGISSWPIIGQKLRFRSVVLISMTIYPLFIIIYRFDLPPIPLLADMSPNSRALRWTVFRRLLLPCIFRALLCRPDRPLSPSEVGGVSANFQKQALWSWAWAIYPFLFVNCLLLVMEFAVSPVCSCERAW